MAINYVELINNDPVKCQSLIEASNFHVHLSANDKLSPETCLNRCHFTNISETYGKKWTEGFCTCNGIPTDCQDFLSFCEDISSSQGIPEFLRHIGFSNWTHVGSAIGGSILMLAIFAICLTLFVRKRSASTIMERTKRLQSVMMSLIVVESLFHCWSCLFQTVFNEHSDIRYMVEDDFDDSEDFINFELATTVQDQRSQSLQECLPEEHVYAALEDIDLHYEVPPVETLSVQAEINMN